MSPIAILLAAGKGTRMRSELPKVLHPLGGRPLVAHPLRAAREAGATRAILVVGHGADAVEAAAREHAPEGLAIDCALQAEQKGTGHAVLCALDALGDYEGPVWILSGDVPLLSAGTLSALADDCVSEGASMSMLSFEPADPFGYGRVLRDENGRVLAIREQKDASPEEAAVAEVNSGVYCVPAGLLRRYIPQLGTNNAQGEMYLTDLIELARAEGRVLARVVDELEVAGVNTPEQLAALEAAYAKAQAPG